MGDEGGAATNPAR